MGRYDISFKDLISGAEKELLKLVGLDVSDLRVLNVEFASVREKRVDKIFECSVGLQKAIVQIEIQLYYERQFHIRMSGYWSDLKLAFPDLPIIQIVLTCGKKLKDSIDEEMKVKSDLGEVSFGYMRFKYTVFDLCEIPFQKFLEFDNPSINALGILSKDCNIQELFRKILEYKLGKEQTVSLITKIYILSKLTQRDKEVKKAMEETQKIDLMEYDLFREAIEKGMKEGLEKGLKEGLEKGLKQGMKQGIKKGLMDGLKQGLELAIKSKFGVRSRNFVAKLRKIEDVEKLKEIARKFQRSRNIKDLEKVLGF